MDAENNPAQDVLSPDSRREILDCARSYDMVAQADEAHYLGQYWHWIGRALDALPQDRPLNVLDLGCGQGRLTLPLARWLAGRQGSRLAGVDLCPEALARCAGHLADNGLGGAARLEEAEALAHLRAAPAASVSALVMAELLYMHPDPGALLHEAARVLEPGGALLASFRGRLFNLLLAVRHRQWDNAGLFLRQGGGHPWGGATRFTWHDPEELPDLLSAHGLRLLAVRGIGCLSGIAGDPLECLARPSLLPEPERQRLLELEIAAGAQRPHTGRYLLAVAVRP